MHTSTLFLVALASIMVTFTSAKPLDKENSVANIRPNFDNQGSRGNFHQKRKMKKRFSPGNSGVGHSSTHVSPDASSGGGIGGGITEVIPLVGPTLDGITGGSKGGLPLAGDLL